MKSYNPSMETRQRVQNKLKELHTKAKEVGIMVQPITVLYDLKGRVAGTADTKGNIRLNAELLHKYPDEVINDTLGHEFAHMMQYTNLQKYYYKNGRGAPHGEYFKKFCKVLGVSGNRCHSMKVESARNVRKWAFDCKCSKPIILKTNLKNKVLNPANNYKCKSCGTKTIDMNYRLVKD